MTVSCFLFSLSLFVLFSGTIVSRSLTGSWKGLTSPLRQICMKKLLLRIQSVLGQPRPTAKRFKEVFNQLPDYEREQLRKDILLLAFAHWSQLPAYFQRFLVDVFKQDRELLLSFLLEETPLGQLRYALFDRDLVLKLFYIVERNKREGRLSFRHLAFVLLLAFDYPYTLRTLAEYLRRQQPLAGEVLQLAGRIEITGDFD